MATMYNQPEIRHVRAHARGKWGTQIIRSLCGKTGKLTEQSSEANCGACIEQLKQVSLTETDDDGEYELLT